MSIESEEYFYRKIGKKLAAVIFLTILTTLTFYSFFNYSSSRDFLIDDTLDKIEDSVKIHALEIESTLQGVDDDVRSISNSPVIQSIIRARNNGGIDPISKSTYARETERMGELFETIAESDSSYSQIRYIDKIGQELVRIDYDDISVTKNMEKELQNKADRYYFADIIGLRKGNMYVSYADLNKEGSPPEIEVPYKPVVRYGTPVFNHETGETEGIIVINVSVKRLPNTFYDKLDADRRFRQEFLVDKHGYYFLNPDKNKEWGSKLDFGTGWNLKKDFAPNIYTPILSGIKGIKVMQEQGQILAYHPVFPYRNDTENFWVVFEVIPADKIFASASHMRNISIITYINFVAVATLSFMFIYRLFFNTRRRNETIHVN